MDHNNNNNQPVAEMQGVVLIVDDDPVSLTLLSEYLQSADLEVATAKTGQEALQKTVEIKPDLLLLDIMLNDIDGFEICRRLKADEKTKDIPVIFMTALSESSHEVKGFDLGAVDYITKPFKVQTVLARVKTHLNFRALQKSLYEQNQRLQRENIRRKRVQEALKESRQRYRLLADNATDLISRQTLDGIYRYVSPACRTLLGYEVEEMIGSSVEEFIHPKDLPEFRARNHPEEWLAADRTTYRARRKDGSYIWLETFSKVIRDPVTGGALEVVAVSRNVTERQQLEEELWNQNKELDAFAHTVAHDLKNPLGAIIGYAHLLQMGQDQMDPEMVRNTLQKVIRSGQEMVNIIDSLLLLAGTRKGEVEPEPLEMTDVVAQALQRLELMVEKYQAEVIKPESWPVALGYPPWIEAVWTNYMSNALKYGGQPPRMELGSDWQTNGMVRFWVRDNGNGLTPKEQASLFAEFTRLDEMRAEGHGLGLSIVRRIIEKSGGQVGVESEVGKGSLFYFTLPAAVDPTESLSPKM